MGSIVVILCVVALFVVPTPSDGCHAASMRTLHNNKKTSIVNTISRCLSDSAGKGFRWQAIVRFAIEDTNWYDETGYRYCIHDQDTDECWRKKLDFLIDEHSPYSMHVKRCIREYEMQEVTLPKLHYDNYALPAARSGRRKRELSPASLLILLQRHELLARNRHTFHTPRPSTQPSMRPTKTALSPTNRPTTSDRLTGKPTLKLGPAQIATSPRLSRYSSTKAKPTETYLLNTQVLPTQRPSVYTIGTTRVSWTSPRVYSLATRSSTQSGFRSTRIPFGYRTYNASKEIPSNLPNWLRPTAPARTVTVPVSSTPPPTARFLFTTRRNYIYTIKQPAYQPPIHAYSSWRHTTQRPTFSYSQYRPTTPQNQNIDYSQLTQSDKNLFSILQLATATPPTTMATRTQNPISDLLNFLTSKLKTNPFQGIAKTDKPSVVSPMITGSLCDNELKTRFLNCVKGKLGMSGGSSRRFLSSQSPDDVISICVFFKDNYSNCAEK